MFQYFKEKLTTRWLGAYEFEHIYKNGTEKLRTIDDERLPLLVNDHWIKLYKKLEFIQRLLQHQYLNLIKGLMGLDTI